MNKSSPPTEFLSYLGGVFWQQWEEDYNGDPAKALLAAGYPSGVDSDASKSLSELLQWIESNSEVLKRLPALDQFYDYEADGFTLLEFLVLTKRFIDGDISAFSKIQHSDSKLS